MLSTYKRCYAAAGFKIIAHLLLGKLITASSQAPYPSFGMHSRMQMLFFNGLSLLVEFITLHENLCTYLINKRGKVKDNRVFAQEKILNN